MEVSIRLYPPLSDTAGKDRFKMILNDEGTIQEVIDWLISEFGEKFRLHLYDTNGKIIPAWCVFINQRVLPMNDPETIHQRLSSGDEVSFLLNLAGG